MLVKFNHNTRLFNSNLFFSLRKTHIRKVDLDQKNRININFIDRDKKVKKCVGYLGETLLEIAHNNKIPIEGACEGGLACSTCHGILDEKDYDKFPPPSEREEDCLDLAPGLCETSRLCCQLKIQRKHDNITVKVPPMTANTYVDGAISSID